MCCYHTQRFDFRMRFFSCLKKKTSKTFPESERNKMKTNSNEIPINTDLGSALMRSKNKFSRKKTPKRIKIDNSVSSKKKKSTKEYLWPKNWWFCIDLAIRIHFIFDWIRVIGHFKALGTKSGYSFSGFHSWTGHNSRIIIWRARDFFVAFSVENVLFWWFLLSFLCSFGLLFFLFLLPRQ